MTDRYVAFVDYAVVHKAAIAMAGDDRHHTIWQDRFEECYNVRFGTLKVDPDRYTVIFPSKHDYLAFILRWA